MERAEIYRRAAEVAHLCNEYSCIAIALCCGYEGGHVDAYQQAYGLYDYGGRGIADFDAAGGNKFRVLALCFAAAMASTGDI